MYLTGLTQIHRDGTRIADYTSSHNYIARPSRIGIASTFQTYSALRKQFSSPGFAVPDVNRTNSSFRDSRQDAWFSSFRTSLWIRLESFMIAAAMRQHGHPMEPIVGGSEGLLRIGISESSTKIVHNYRQGPSGVVVLLSPPTDAENPPLLAPSRFLTTLLWPSRIRVPLALSCWTCLAFVLRTAAQSSHPSASASTSHLPHIP